MLLFKKLGINREQVAQKPDEITLALVPIKPCCLLCSKKRTCCCKTNSITPP
ncbi:biotin synthase [Vibrio cholerae]|nr:biotin synthase [Vibrio cholerae]